MRRSTKVELNLVRHERYGSYKQDGYSGYEFDAIRYNFSSERVDLELGYTSDYGGKLGRLVGEKLLHCPHVTLGGDGDYADAMKAEAMTNKFPGDSYGFVEIGNHERDVEGSSFGHLKKIFQLAIDFDFTKKGRLITHRIKKDNLPIPTTEIFLDVNEKRTPFCIVHVDSNLLPGIKNYKTCLVELLKDLKIKYPKLDIVLSLHHAPDAYGPRRYKAKDQDKYKKHIAKYYEPLADKEFLAKTDKKSKDKKEKEPCSWNQEVANALNEVYSKVEQDSNFRIIATQSGHDHGAYLMNVGADAPLAIVQGNGSQEGVRLINASKQHLKRKYARKAIKEHKLFGADIEEVKQADAKYLRLGYGKWVVGEVPTYQQYYFTNPNNINSPVLMSTRTEFFPDRRVITDYLARKIITIYTDPSALKTIPQKGSNKLEVKGEEKFEAGNKDAIPLKSMNLSDRSVNKDSTAIEQKSEFVNGSEKQKIEVKDFDHPLPDFKAYFEKKDSFFKNKDIKSFETFIRNLGLRYDQKHMAAFRTLLIEHYLENNISLESLLQLHRFMLEKTSKKDKKEVSLNRKEFSSVFYDYAATKKIVDPKIIVNPNTQTMKDFKVLSEIEILTLEDQKFVSVERKEIYKEETALICHLRDLRERYFKNGTIESNLMLFKTPKAYDKSKLCATEKAIQELSLKFNEQQPKEEAKLSV